MLSPSKRNINFLSLEFLSSFQFISHIKIHFQLISHLKVKVSHFSFGHQLHFEKEILHFPYVLYEQQHAVESRKIIKSSSIPQILRSHHLHSVIKFISFITKNLTFDLSVSSKTNKILPIHYRNIINSKIKFNDSVNLDKENTYRFLKTTSDLDPFLLSQIK